MILKNLKDNSGILIRFDDIAPNMNWAMMDKCQNLLNSYDIKPVLGVIPNNEDPDLLSYPKREKFWNIVNEWKNNGWSIAMHGYNHLYDRQTNKKDYFNYGGGSEFCGHTYEHQLSKLKKSYKIFNENNIKVDTFFAPNHTYDLNTFKALKQIGINRIIDGYGLIPYYSHEIKFLPQLFYKLIVLPFGIQTTQLHINYWNNRDYEEFKIFIDKNHKKIINLEHAFSRDSNSFVFNMLNLILTYTLKLKRKIF